MYHDKLIPEAERPNFHVAYRALGEALGACIGYLNFVYKEAEIQIHEDGRYIHAVSLMQLFDFIELMDGIYLLINQGSSSNCTHLLRCAFEINISILFMLENEKEYERRSLSYEYWNHLNTLEWYHRCNKGTNKGAEARRELKGEKFEDALDITVCANDIKKATDELESKMAGQRYISTHNEYKRMVSSKKKPKNWFSLWDGPETLRALAKHVGQLANYEVFYRSWSTASHGEASLKRITGLNNGTPLIVPLRSPAGLTEKARNATNMALAVANLFTDKIATKLHKIKGQYYLEKIKPKMAAIDNINFPTDYQKII